jgi:hypothetical protein
MGTSSRFTQNLPLFHIFSLFLLSFPSSVQQGRSLGRFRDSRSSIRTQVEDLMNAINSIGRDDTRTVLALKSACEAIAHSVELVDFPSLPLLWSYFLCSSPQLGVFFYSPLHLF